MLGSQGSGDALGTWLLVMLAGALFGVGGGVLAHLGRWRAWHRHPGPFRYAPLATLPFGIGCLVQIGSLLSRPAPPVDAVLSAVLMVSVLTTCLLLLRFPRRLKPRWVLAAEEKEGAGAGDSSP